MAEYYLGIDLGGTDTKLGILDEQGRIIRSAKTPTHAEKGPEGVLADLAASGKDLIASSGHSVKAVGMGCPGPLSSKLGVVFETPNLPGWVDVPAQKMLEDHMQLPVALNNDANAAAYGEWWVGAGREVDTLILFTLGTGVGGGLVLDDELYGGPDDTAGELGHMIINFDGPVCGCGNRGCIEAYASATALRRDVKQALAEGVKTSIRIPEGAEEEFGARAVYDAAMEGDAFAIEQFRKMGYYLGIAAATVINIFNPEMIAYGGGVSNAGDFIFKPLEETARANCFKTPGDRVRIVRATLGNDAGIIGAAGLAMKRYKYL
jgi:glucokinase